MARQDSGDGRDETDLSALEPGSQTASWIPCAHVHKGRTQDTECAPDARPQVTECIIKTSMHDACSIPGNGRVSLETLPVAVVTIKRRSDFISAAASRQYVTLGVLVQARNRCDNIAEARFGITCSKKIGNAVTRNRAKRRLREAAKIMLPDLARSGWDYVLIGRPEKTVARRFSELKKDIGFALVKLHKKP